MQDARRGTPYERGYDPRWRDIRDAFLKDHPICEHCGGTATLVHHRKRIRDGGTNDYSNLIALCASCHGKYHAHEGHSWAKDKC